MRKRQTIDRRHSEAVFTRGAERIHPRNGLSSVSLRGGIRL